MVGSAFTSSIAACKAILATFLMIVWTWRPFHWRYQQTRAVFVGHSATSNASVDNVGNTVVGNHGHSDQRGHSATTNTHVHHAGNADVSSSGGRRSNIGVTGLLAKQEKTRIHFPLSAILEVDPQNYQYDECIKDCKKAVERGMELCSDYKMVATALTRKGNVLVKMAKVSKDFEPAITTFQKTLTEHRNPDTLKNLNDAERAMKELEQQVYYDPKLAEKEREKAEISHRGYASLEAKGYAKANEKPLQHVIEESIYNNIFIKK
ncbi:HSP70-HSP90 organizing protein 3-like protein [Tanacetum coccineum]